MTTASATAPFWLSAFLDFAPEQHAEGSRLWERLTGFTTSPTRGDDGEFTTLLPEEGDAWLRVQRLGEGPTRIHLDLHVGDVKAAADTAVGRGAHLIADHSAIGYVVLESPGGLVFCFVDAPFSVPTPPTRWPAGHTSSPDQVCVDVPSPRWETETAFWHDVTGWPLLPSPTHREFHRLDRPRGLPLAFLLQRLDSPEGKVRAHLDFATTDRPAETTRHQSEGSRLLRTTPNWTVLEAAGLTYCITDRQPTP
ncbi:hypothetical protein LO762_27485 [Actinocorallia sp. API 0066]|uniref:VOC family protein n=1 Tax=Actinocorallia sp. API 0066 TaxID=2896846 RepID=UPI001E2FA39B|nr:VOC family protein [Actinocorallia sp. API 0066]MCD0452895.1 hypothetical protein [Actinocorallia sp. API 0066]